MRDRAIARTIRNGYFELSWIIVSTPQPRQAYELRNRQRRVLAIHAEARKFELTEETAKSRSVERERKCHRLTWFEALQGLLLLAVVMLGATYAIVSGLLICTAIATSVVAIVAGCLKAGAPKPLHLVLAALWAIVGAIYTAAQMS
jgi:hypothetical protein